MTSKNEQPGQSLYGRVSSVASEEIKKGRFEEGGLRVEEAYRRPRLKAQTHLVTKEIHIGYSPTYETDNPGKTEIFARDATRHEINHHGYSEAVGCPKDVDRHERLFISPMTEILSEKGFTAEDVHYVSNCLQDDVLHCGLSEIGCGLEGIVSFFEEQGNNSSEDKETRKRKFTPFYEAHTKLNMYLWGNKKQKKKLQRFYAHDERVTDALEDFFERLGISEMKEEMRVYERSRAEVNRKGKIKKRMDRKDEVIQIKDRKRIRDFFLDESNWEEISRVYAEVFSELMEPGYAQGIMNHSGAGTKGRESEDSDNEGNYFDKKMKTKKFKMKRIEKAHRQGESTPVWMDDFEAMDFLYQGLARRLVVKAETYIEERQMPVHYYGERDFDPEKDNFKQVRFGFDEEGNFGLKKREHSYDIPLSVKRREKGFPESKFGILDTSGSMEYDVNGGEEIGNTGIVSWGDKSRYHFALLGWYGLLEYLKQNHLLRQSSVSAANFSRETRVGRGLENAKRNVLNPQFGRTNLNMQSIDDFFSGQGNLIFTISDGAISNWDDIGEDFIGRASNHYYFHLQIGGGNQMTQDLEEAGLRVEGVLGEEDLAERTIDLTDSLLRTPRNKRRRDRGLRR